MCGVALATLALVCTLSVFNGFQDLVATLFTAFDPQLKIVSNSGKVFDSQDDRILQLKQMTDVEVLSESLEDFAMVQYKGKQTMVTIKGIQDNFRELTAIDSILYGRGDMVLRDEIVDYVYALELENGYIQDLEDFEEEHADFAIDIVGGELTYNSKTNDFTFYLSIYHASEDNNAENVEYHTDEEEYSFSNLNLGVSDDIN